MKILIKTLLGKHCLGSAQVHSLQKELETENGWGKHVKILIDKLSPSLEVSKLESVNKITEAPLLEDLKKEFDLLKQSEISLKKEIECLKDSRAGLIEDNMYLQKVIASQESSFEDFRQWVEDTFINKVSFTTFNPTDIEEMIKSDDVIGSGGYRKVYRASSADKDVAVKILNLNTDQGLREFDTEVTLLKKVHHKNLIHIIGACPSKHGLVYEFLGNGTLHEWLCAQAGDAAFLTWQQRINTAFDICSVLVFLHKMKPKPIVHCDLKPDNIIFDADDVPKISDFEISYELSKVSETGTWHHMTLGTPTGTPFYMVPEFRDTRKVTPSADIHAFGMLLLQLITGQGSSRLVKFVEEQLERFEKVKQRASPLQKKVLRTLGLADKNLSVHSWNPKAVVLLLKLGLACTHEDRKQRSSLSGHVWPQLYMIREEIAFC